MTKKEARLILKRAVDYCMDVRHFREQAAQYLLMRDLERVLEELDGQDFPFPEEEDSGG